jgi:hypothetical protein
MNVPNLNVFLAFAKDATFECCVLPLIIIGVIIIVSIITVINSSAEQKRLLALAERESAKRQKEEAARQAQIQKETNERIEKQKQQLAEAQEKYYESLEKLKSEPTNADLKQNTLQLGREYSEATRQFEGDGRITIYDEIALMNDINAACAAAGAMSSQTIEERLSKLSELKEKNLISEQEYEEKRLKILDEI